MEARGYDSGRRCALVAEGEQVPGRRAAWTGVEAADSWETAAVTSQRARASPLGAGSGCHEHQSGLAAARHAAAYRMRCPSCSIRSATCCTCAAICSTRAAICCTCCCSAISSANTAVSPPDRMYSATIPPILHGFAESARAFGKVAARRIGTAAPSVTSSPHRPPAGRPARTGVEADRFLPAGSSVESGAERNSPARGRLGVRGDEYHAAVRAAGGRDRGRLAPPARYLLPPGRAGPSLLGDVLARVDERLADGHAAAAPGGGLDVEFLAA